MSSSSSSQPAAASRLIVIGGGVRSGKSRLAVELALQLGQQRAFVATARAFDDEMRERIDAHQRERQGRFTTFEAPRNLAQIARAMPSFDVILVDCLTIYVSNLLLEVSDIEKLDGAQLRRLEEVAIAELTEGVRELRQKARHLVFVTNEVGMGVVPVSRLGRVFRDLAGRVNQSIASEANEVWWCALGIPLRLKPGVAAASELSTGVLS